MHTPVRGMLEGSMGSCQKPDFRSSLRYTLHLLSFWMTSRAWGMGWLSLIVWRLRGRKSMTMRSLSLRGLGTQKHGDAHGVASLLTNPTRLSS